MIEAIILAGGKGERLGDAAEGKPKALAKVGDRPLVGYQLDVLRRGGVERAILSCAADKGAIFEQELSIDGIEIAIVEEPEPLGRGGGLRYAAAERRSSGDIVALNGDELLDLNVVAMLTAHGATDAAATIAVAPLVSQFGVVDIDDNDRVGGFREAPTLPFWVNCGFYILGEEAVERLPERGDHERSTFPELALEGKLRAHRHDGVWLTVNTPKELRTARDYVEANPDWGAA
ncbi:MAG: nucleotidyltransferase family protein [Gaiellaceae bacterium]